MTDELKWTNTRAGGTGLVGYLLADGTREDFCMTVAKLLTLSGQTDALTGGDKASVDFTGTFKGKPFTIYDYKSDFALHIGGFRDLDVDGLITALHSALQTVQPTPFQHRTEYDAHVRYGWPKETV